MTQTQRNCTPSLPEEDVARLAGLSPSELQIAALARIEEYRAQIEQINGFILELLSTHNTVAPMAKLPAELLMHIFHHFRPDSYRDLQVKHVCRTWYSVIHDTPEFWVDILSSRDLCAGLTKHPDVLQSYVERTSPRSIALSTLGANTFMRTIVPHHLSRVVVLSIHFPERNLWQSLSAFLDLDLPNLGNLECTYAGRDLGPVVELEWPDFDHTPRSDRFPRLRRLSIDANIFTPALAISSLKWLTLDGCVTIEVDVFLVALQRLVYLEVLQMPSTIWRYSVISFSGPRIHLPRLREWYIECGYHSFDWLRVLLEYITLPSLASIKIDSHIWYWQDSLCSFIPSPLRVSNLLSNTDKITFAYSPIRSRRTNRPTLKLNAFANASPRLYLDLTYVLWQLIPGIGGLTLLGVFAEKFSLLWTITHLEFDFGQGISILQEDWLAVLHAFPQLLSLTVRVVSARHLLRVLEKYAAFPLLTRLSVTCGNGSGVHESLVAAVESRAARGLARLDHLEFSHLELDDSASGVIRPPSLSAPRLARLKAVVDNVSIWC